MRHEIFIKHPSRIDSVVIMLKAKTDPYVNQERSAIILNHNSKPITE